MVERLKKSIVNEAKKQAEIIKRNAEIEAEKIISEAKKEASLIESKALEEAEKKAQEKLSKEISILRLQARKEVLETRKQEIEKVFNKAKENIEKMKGKEREEIIKKLALSALKELPESKYYYCNNEDKKIIQQLLPKLEFAGTINETGIILENKEKTIKENKTFSLILEKIKESEINEINKLLFRET